MTKKKQKLNVRLLRKIQRHILAEPLRYNQNTTIVKGKPGETYREINKFGSYTYPKKGVLAQCGTAACIGGWALLLDKKKHKPVFNYDLLKKILGIDDEEANALFSTTFDEGWPSKYLKAYKKAKTARGRARVAVNRINHFIKTRE